MVTIRFGTRVDDLLVKDGCVVGVKMSDSREGASCCKELGCDAVVLAVGHSARDTYQMLLSHNVDVVQKEFSVGLRIEHPQELIDGIQYSGLAGEVQRGRGKVPVADYQVAEYVTSKERNTTSNLDATGTSMPPSSYRLGVKPANLHELFPIEITEALQNAILIFDKELLGFFSDNALLHGVETRTSSPIQITRKSDTLESTSLKGMYPVGEGAGFAGGIVSAAVDGMHAGFAIAKNLGLCTDDIESIPRNQDLSNTEVNSSLPFPEFCHFFSLVAHELVHRDGNGVHRRWVRYAAF